MGVPEYAFINMHELPGPVARLAWQSCPGRLADWLVGTAAAAAPASAAAVVRATHICRFHAM